MCSKAFYRSVLFFYRLLLRRLRLAHGTNIKLQRCPSLDCLGTLGTTHDLVFDLEGGLLRSTDTFPYFMLVAIEAGSFLRGFFLLLIYPLICCLSRDMGLRVMTMVTFCGLRVKGFRLGRAVLPKHLFEDVGLEAFEVLGKFKNRICFSGMPRVMVEGFVKEYLGVEVVVGREISVLGGYFTGLMESRGKMVHGEMKREVELIAKQSENNGVVGLGGLEAHSSHDIFSICKEVYLASEAEKRKWLLLPRSRYPKPLIFHDGRIALRPTPENSIALFLWLPLSIPLAIIRAALFLSLPRYLYLPILASLGMVSRKVIKKCQEPEHRCIDIDMITGQEMDKDKCSKGQIYVCNHRTLLDPLYISGAIGHHVTATTYSVSRLAEILSPIKTIRLTRNKEVDRKKLEVLLNEGDVVVCPEGTTCREPYLLRFSPLFSEMNRPVIPVALASHVSMFYGTTASGRKYLDPLYFVMNPWPCYTIEFLEEVDARNGDNLGKQWNSHYEVANYVQRKIGKALGYECTTLTRRDKYLMLADNEGIV